MLCVFIENAKRFKDFLNLDKHEYIDVRVSGNFMYFISNSPEVLGIYQAKYRYTEESTGDFSFRVNRFLLSKLYSDGIIAFDFTADSIVTAIYTEDGKLRYSYKSVKQSAYDGEYAERFRLLESLDLAGSQVTLDDLSYVNNITRYSPSVVHVSNGIAGVTLKDGSRIFKRVECKGNFSLSSYALNLLLKFAVSAYNVRNYLCIKLGDMRLCITKANVLSQEEFQYVEEQKSALICDVDLSNLCSLYAQLDVKLPYVEIDFNTTSIVFEHHNSVFTIPLTVTNLKYSQGYEVKPIRLPSSIITEIFQKTKLTTFRLYKKKNFNELEAKDLYVVFR